jgi:hypothetical protein
MGGLYVAAPPRLKFASKRAISCRATPASSLLFPVADAEKSNAAYALGNSDSKQLESLVKAVNIFVTRTA